MPEGAVLTGISCGEGDEAPAEGCSKALGHSPHSTAGNHGIVQVGKALGDQVQPSATRVTPTVPHPHISWTLSRMGTLPLPWGSLLGLDSPSVQDFSQISNKCIQTWNVSPRTLGSCSGFVSTWRRSTPWGRNILWCPQGCSGHGHGGAWQLWGLLCNVWWLLDLLGMVWGVTPVCSGWTLPA